MAKYLLVAPDEMVKGWKAAAKRDGMPLAEWLRQAAETRRIFGFAGNRRPIEEVIATVIAESPPSFDPHFKPDPK